VILLATNKRDLTSDFVALALEKRKLPFFRLNTEDLSGATIRFQPEHGEQGWTAIFSDGRECRFSDVAAGYLRRPEAPTISSDIAGDVQRSYASSEWNMCLVSALRSLHSRWLNSPIAVLSAENKPRQLALAIQQGFSVPITTVTNDPSIVRSFVSKHSSIAKTLSSSLFGSAPQERVIFTNRLELGNLQSDAAIFAAPFILQQEIPKRCDLRITVVGRRVFAAEILSQAHKETEVDWRAGARPDLIHREHSLPDVMTERCISFTRLLGLKFAAIDLVLDQDNKYWFLELNPNGQWAWIENRLGMTIADAIVDELLDISTC
jgi:glutathione synthase/RimK-type ligase-like ATP-grasp enzyme